MNAMPTTDEQQKIILIIDDMPANVAVLGEYLSDRDFVVLVAQDGEAGVQRAQLTQPHSYYWMC